MIQLHNELMNVPFKCTKQCQKGLDYITQIITASPILASPDPVLYIYLFTDSSKHSWSGILIQHTAQTKEQTKIKVPHPTAYQSDTYQGCQKNWGT